MAAKKKLSINIELVEKGQMPTKGSDGAAGYDLCARLDEGITILPGQTKFIPLGIKTEIPEGYVGLMFARSGMAGKKGIAPANKVGVIDSDYRGEWLMAAYNHGHDRQLIMNGDKVAQAVFIKAEDVTFTQVDSVDKTDRGEGGFGSTDKKEEENKKEE